LRTRPAADPIKFTVDKTKLKSAKANDVSSQNGTPTVATTTPTASKTPAINGKLMTDTPTINGVATNGTASTNGVPETNGVDKEMTSNADLIEQLKLACSLKNKEACLMCSS
jgi:ribonucleoside-diphosphate reductase subunit M1